MQETLTGEVERVTFESEETGFRVIKVGGVPGRGVVPVVGRFTPVGPGTRVRVTGKFVQDPKHGEQFRADSVVPLAPSTLAGLERYLGSGLIAGVGPGYAKRIVQHFAEATLTVLDSEPERLSEVTGLGEKRAEAIRAAWVEQRSISNVMLLLQTHGASPALATRIFRHYGDRAAEVVQSSPYRLAIEVRGVGFKTADRLARSLGIAGDHPERAQAGVLHELGTITERGHVCCPRETLEQRAAEMLEVDIGHVIAAVDKLRAAERVVVDGDDVFPARLHRAELSVAEQLARLLEARAAELGGLDRAIGDFEREAGVQLAPQQRSAVEAAAHRKVVVITGGPGTGKTTIVRAITSVFDRARVGVRLAAPTGRAAKRLSEATGRDATTLHRLLEFDPRGRRFQRNAEEQLDAGAVIVDEASMVDVLLAEALLEALPSAARLVIVGDADQLPSVGAGAVLRDLISSGRVCVVRLETIFRQAGESSITVNAHRILYGEPPASASIEEPGADFFVIDRRDPEDAASVIRELVTRRIPGRFELDPFDQIQVLAPMHRGAAGTIALNAMLQQALNPDGSGFTRAGQQLKPGDKVMQTKNDYERDVYNGDVGRVLRAEPSENRLVVRFDEREVIYDDAAIDMLTLAYATSVHKSQGSEYPAVVLPLLNAHFVMLSRNLLYTAVTRARRLCVLVADPRALRTALGETRREQRLTRLAERLRTLT